MKRCLSVVALSAVFSLSACLAPPETTEPTASPSAQSSPSVMLAHGVDWGRYISTKKRKLQKGEVIAPISLKAAVGLCKKILASGGDFKPIIAKGGLPHSFKHTGQPNALWSVSQNAYSIEGILVFYDRLGNVRNVMYSTSARPFFGGGISYWMDADEACKPGIVHSDRPRGSSTGDQWFNRYKP